MKLVQCWRKMILKNTEHSNQIFEKQEQKQTEEPIVSVEILLFLVVCVSL